MDVQTPSNPVNVLPLIACIVIWAISPHKLAAFGRMAIAFFAFIGVVLIVGFFFRMPPYILGKMAAVLGLLVAAVTGLQFNRSLKAGKQESK
jgi:hypothetical protein